MNLDLQQEALSKTLLGPLLVIAPVGTGKTAVLAHRAVNAIKGGIRAENILCLTFTNRAADQMKKRVQEYVPADEVRYLQIVTFHGFCAFLIRTEAKRIGMPCDYIIYDEQDSADLLTEIARKYGIEGPRKEMEQLQYSVQQCKSDASNGELSQEEIPPQSIFQSIFEKYRNPEIKNVIERYHQTLFERHALDFADLIFRARSILQEYPQIKERWSSRYAWIQVDEVQDTHNSEYEVLRILAKKHKNLALFGDVDQTIYEWRGSKPFEIIKRFKKDFAPIKEMSLKINYRSTETLTKACSSFANSFEERHTSNIPVKGCEKGQPIVIHSEENKATEAQWVGKYIQKMAREKGFQYNDTAVLTRTNPGGAVVSNIFGKLGVPHTTVEQYEFFRRQEIKDAIAYLRILVNRYDVNSLHRILLRPRKGIGDAAVRDIVSSGQEVGLRLMDMVLLKTFTMGEPYGFLLESLSAGEITVLDVETTGLIPVRDEVIEIAGVKLSKGKVCEKFHCYVKNTVPVGDSQKIHGLTDKFLQVHGKDPAEALDAFKHFIGNGPVVGHNIAFDVRILVGHAIRSGIQMAIWSFEDTLDMAKRFLTAERYDLESLTNLLGLSARPSHKAMDDVLCTLKLLGRLVKFATPGASKRKEIVSKYEKSFKPLAESIQAWRNHLNSRRPPELLDIILYESGLRNYYQGDPKRLQHLEELQRIFAERDNAKLDPQSAMEEILSFTALSKNIDHLMENDNRVPVITLHQAKGLEFDNVFIVGVAEDEIPHYYSKKEGRIEEERRLFYVGMTRGKKRLIISNSKRDLSGRPKMPSQFLKCIAPDVIQKE